MSEPETVVGPMTMGVQLVEALGLKGVNGILKLQIAVEAGKLPTLTIVRSITHEQAGAACSRLLEWQCELVPKGAPVEREVRPDGTVVAAEVPLFADLEPKAQVRA